MSDMKISNRGLVEIASHEGICLRPYRDSVGVLTIGVGHTKSAGAPDPLDLDPGMDQPIGAVFEWFRRDLASVEADVNRLVKVPLKPHEFDALVSFHFNTGGLGRSNLLRRLNAMDYAGAAEGFMGWTKPPEIIGRRKKEQALFRDGVYSSNGKVNVFPVNARQQPVYSKGRAVDVMALLGRDPEPEPPMYVPDVEIPPPRQTEPETTPTPPQPAGFFNAVRQWWRLLFH